MCAALCRRAVPGCLLTRAFTACAANPPNVNLAYTPGGALPLNGAAGRCNAYVPNTTTLARFLWTVGFLARNNFIIVIGALSRSPPVQPPQFVSVAAC